jgi:hypothetical protein
MHRRRRGSVPRCGPRVSRSDSTKARCAAALPQITTITAMKKWIYPSAALADREPLFDGLRMAGVRD